MTEEIKKEDQLIEVPEHMIDARFMMDDIEIVVLNNETLKQNENNLILGKIVDKGEDLVIEQLTDQEYMTAVQKYAEIEKLFKLENWYERKTI